VIRFRSREINEPASIIDTVGGVTFVEVVREELHAFGDQHFQRGIPNQSWICFVVRGTSDSLLQGATLHLTLTDSFGKKYLIKSNGPWKCKGSMVNPEMLS
jgi:hypothetical protein